MNSFESFSNLIKDDLTSATWPYPNPYTSVPQSTYPEWVSDGYPTTAGSYIPNFNAVDDAANLVSSQCVKTSTHMIYPATTECPRPVVYVRPMYVPFLHRLRSFVFTRCESKAIDMNSADSQPQLVGMAPLAADSAATGPDVSVNVMD